jgi:hypothetical protein
LSTLKKNSRLSHQWAEFQYSPLLGSSSGHHEKEAGTKFDAEIVQEQFSPDFDQQAVVANTS